jgi:hypothetical protein
MEGRAAQCGVLHEKHNPPSADVNACADTAARPRVHSRRRADHPPGQTDDIEQRVLENYVRAQCLCLIRNNSYEDFLLVRTLGDHHQHAASEAKAGDLRRARVQMRALASMRPAGKELGLACLITAEPVNALIEWKSGDPAEAIRRLRSALHAAATLATNYAHGYLTARRIYLASNIARVYASLNQRAAAANLVRALAAVTAGERQRWPFDASESLDVPLCGDEFSLISGQLSQLLSAR